jgi:hypothetical protein
MENTSPTYRITTKKSGIVIADNLPRSAPAIQLQEGMPVVGHLHPKDLSQGGETFVVYPLDKKASIVCKVERIDGIAEVQPEKPQTQPTIEEPMPVAVRRGRGRKALQ